MRLRHGWQSVGLVLAWGLICLLLGLTISACGSRSPNRESSSATRDDAGSVTLEFWTIALKPKFIPYFERLFAEFEALHPGVTVRWLDLPQASILPKLMASIAGDVPPDVVNLTTGTALVLARSGALVDLRTAVSPTESAVYWPALWEAARIGKGIYAVPWYVSTRVLMYNQHLLQQAGWPATRPPTTWDEVATIARLVRERTPAYGYEPVIRLIDDWRMEGLTIYDPQSGRATFNNARGSQRLAWYAQLRRQGLIPEETLIEGYQGALDRYKQGNLALLEAGPQLLLAIEADAPQVYTHTAVAPLPRGRSGEIPAALMDLVVPRSSRHRDLAVKLALFVTNKTHQLELVREVPLLPSTIVSEADLFPNPISPNDRRAQALRCSFKQLERARDFSLGLARANELEKVLKEAVETVYYGQGTPEQALQSAAQQWNSIVEAE